MHALVVLSACGSGGNGQPMLVDAGTDAAVGVDASDTPDAGNVADAGGMADAAVPHCTRFTFSTSSPPSYPTGLTPNSLAVKDVNKDGKPDLVVADEDADTISVLLGNGSGTFKTKVDYPTGSGPTDLVVVDVNKDGILDIIVANRGSATVSVLLGNGDGTFKDKGSFATDLLPAALAVGDVNGDTKPDIVVANSGNDLGSFVSVLIGNGDGTFKPKTDIPTDGSLGAIAVADLNKDGKLDVVVTNGTDSLVSVLLGNGNGTFQANVDFPLAGLGAVASAVVVVDVNHDGKLDIVAADNQTNRANVFLGKGDGSFQAEIDILVGQTPQGLAVTDVTGDGVPDIVTVGLVAQAISVLAGKGDGTFQDRVDTLVGSMPAALTVADLNGDGVPDIVVGDQDHSTAIVLLGQCVP
ncbi:MAG TPA: VCBS repeat-containing protein [Kofleriaceae bacterium]